MFRQAAVVFFLLSSLPAARAATMAPPMLDITRQCDVNSRHNATAMSECVVAESEARSEILQKWATLPDANADRCVKLGRKSKRFPYSAIAKCLADAALPPILPPPVAPARGAPPPVAAAAPVPTLAAPPPATAPAHTTSNPFQTFKNKLFGN